MTTVYRSFPARALDSSLLARRQRSTHYRCTLFPKGRVERSTQRRRAHVALRTSSFHHHHVPSTVSIAVLGTSSLPAFVSGWDTGNPAPEEVRRSTRRKQGWRGDENTSALVAAVFSCWDAEERVGTALWRRDTPPARLPSQASSCALRERPALPVRALARLSLTATPKRLAHYARYRWSPHVLSGAAPLPRCGDKGALAHTQDGYADTHAPVCATVSLGVDLASQLPLAPDSPDLWSSRPRPAAYPTAYAAPRRNPSATAFNASKRAHCASTSNPGTRLGSPRSPTSLLEPLVDPAVRVHAALKRLVHARSSASAGASEHARLTLSPCPRSTVLSSAGHPGPSTAQVFQLVTAAPAARAPGARPVPAKLWGSALAHSTRAGARLRLLAYAAARARLARSDSTHEASALGSTSYQHPIDGALTSSAPTHGRYCRPLNSTPSAAARASGTLYDARPLSPIAPAAITTPPTVRGLTHPDHLATSDAPDPTPCTCIDKPGLSCVYEGSTGPWTPRIRYGPFPAMLACSAPPPPSLPLALRHTVLQGTLTSSTHASPVLAPHDCALVERARSLKPRTASAAVHSCAVTKHTHARVTRVNATRDCTDAARALVHACISLSTRRPPSRTVRIYDTVHACGPALRQLTATHCLRYDKPGLSCDYECSTASYAPDASTCLVSSRAGPRVRLRTLSPVEERSLLLSALLPLPSRRYSLVFGVAFSIGFPSERTYTYFITATMTSQRFFHRRDTVWVPRSHAAPVAFVTLMSECRRHSNTHIFCAPGLASDLAHRPPFPLFFIRLASPCLRLQRFLASKMTYFPRRSPSLRMPLPFYAVAVRDGVLPASLFAIGVYVELAPWT
ncbi:hypothetical protein B0H14DRAFT_3904694 [Mycena olivaceomarginata]|nr:hypothetical protein B0H14DRAFT_3904694 [Mycena olivaceomarginata]